jgi:hypothetical protein
MITFRSSSWLHKIPLTQTLNFLTQRKVDLRVLQDTDFLKSWQEQEENCKIQGLLFIDNFKFDINFYKYPFIFLISLFFKVSSNTKDP